jgi:type IV pilus assembly protein PilY1
MNPKFKKWVVYTWLISVLLTKGFAWSQSLPAVPPNISSGNSKPMMMIAASRDQTLFGPVYSDFEDVDDDGIIDFTFKPAFVYYGYFDSSKCYSYSTSSNRFNPEINSTKTSDGRLTCPSVHDYWSGNFLNWATMTRLDTVRKMLYGGKRSTDSATETVVERANVSQDAHSFTKYYNGTDVRDYTPYTTAYLSKGDPLTYKGLTICNRSSANDSGGNPVIRVVRGNYELWATTAGTVCRWSAEGGPNFGNNLVAAYTSVLLGSATIAHEVNAPNEINDGATYSGVATSELIVRVKVCDPTKLGNERCQLYGSGGSAINKPIGLLQEFGATTDGSAAKAEFGLITGSYESNIEGGALRKNMGTFNNEINSNNGRFCHIAGGCTTTVSLGIASIDNIVLYGAGNYNGNNGMGFAHHDEMVNGLFPAWGNPMGEMLLQAIRYYSNKPIDRAATNPGLTTGIDAALNIPTVTATNPLTSTTTRNADYGKPICRPLTILAVSSSAVSHDRNFSGFSDLPNRGTSTVAGYTNRIGLAEGIHGTARAVGSVSAGWGTDCAAKTITSLSDVTGVCPDLPGAQGSFLSAGAAFYANTSKVIGSVTLPSDAPSSALTIQTYVAALRGGLGRVEVKIPGTNKFFFLTPESSWNNRDYVSGTVTGGQTVAQRRDRYPNRPDKTDGILMPGGILVFKAISSSATHGAFVVTWNDTQAGNDYDMDIVGFLRYDIIGTGSAAQVKVTTHISDQEAGALGSHGFSIIGTTNSDGKYITHGINSFQDEGVCLTTNCTLGGSAPATQTFALAGVNASAVLEDPLWYAAKYGGFDTKGWVDGSTITTARWDQKRADGRACGGTTGLSCSDGIPDGYFLARRPELLEKQLREQLENIVASSNAAPAVSSSQLIDGSFKYVAEYDPTLKKGSILAYQLDRFGDFSVNKSWDAGELLKQLPLSQRQVMSNNEGTGVAFDWSTLPAALKTKIKGTGGTALSDARAEALLNYMRGNVDNEEPNGERFQPRSISNILGTVVNSTPWIQLPSNAYYFDGTFPTSGVQSYLEYARTKYTREKLLWVGANDGMLHGFNADSGAPVISYIPETLAPKLANLVEKNSSIVSGLDGSPFSGDVLRSAPTGQTATWATYLFTPLGRGGKGVFALDVSNVDSSALNQANAANIFKWQFSDANDNDMGNIVGEYSRSPFSNQAVPIVRLNNGKFAVALPNGINSTNQRSSVFLLGVDGPTSGTTTWTLGSNYYKLTTTVADSNNGMMGLNWVDVDNNGTVDFIYATDLKGNIWKFDVTSSDPAKWSSAFKTPGVVTPPLPEAPKSFYTAKDGSNNPLPVTTSPVFGFPRYGGVVVMFGTGIALSSGDFPNIAKTQRIFGILDRTGTTGTATFTLPTGTSTLVQRTTTVSATESVKISNSPVIDFANQDGWYFDLPGTSEMLLSSPSNRSGRVGFTTVRKLTVTTEACFETPPARFYFIDPVFGVGDLSMEFAGIPTPDQKIQLVTDNSSRAKGPDPSCKNDAACQKVCDDDPNKCKPKCEITTIGTRIIGKNADGTFCLPTNMSRIQWREIPGLTTKQ